MKHKTDGIHRPIARLTRKEQGDQSVRKQRRWKKKEDESLVFQRCHHHKKHKPIIIFFFIFLFYLFHVHLDLLLM